MPVNGSSISAKIRAIVSTILPSYYRIKVAAYRVFCDDEALAYVLHDCLFPEVVLRLGGAEIGTNTRVHRWLLIHESRGSFRNLKVGNDVFLGKRIIIDLTDSVTVGNRCAVGMDVKIITHSNFGASALAVVYPPVHAPVEISDDAIVNWGAIINKGTRVGKGVIVLPGTVVTGILKDGLIYAGNPARPIPQKPQ